MALKISSIALACNHSQNFDSLIYLTKTMAQKFDASIHIFLYEGTKIDLSGKLDGINFKIELCNNPIAKDLRGRLNSIKPDLLILSTSCFSNKSLSFISSYILQNIPAKNVNTDNFIISVFI